MTMGTMVTTTVMMVNVTVTDESCIRCDMRGIPQEKSSAAGVIRYRVQSLWIRCWTQ